MSDITDLIAEARQWRIHLEQGAAFHEEIKQNAPTSERMRGAAAVVARLGAALEAVTVRSESDREVLLKIVGAAVYGDPENLSRATEATDEIIERFRLHVPAVPSEKTREEQLLLDILEGAPSERVEDAIAFRVADTLAYYRCRSSNPKADDPHMGYHAFSEHQREHLRGDQAEATAEIVRIIAECAARLPVPVVPEWDHTYPRTEVDGSVTNYRRTKGIPAGEWEVFEPVQVDPQPHNSGRCPNGGGYSCTNHEPHDPAQVTEGGAQ